MTETGNWRIKRLEEAEGSAHRKHQRGQCTCTKPSTVHGDTSVCSHSHVKRDATAQQRPDLAVIYLRFHLKRAVNELRIHLSLIHCFISTHSILMGWRRRGSNLIQVQWGGSSTEGSRSSQSEKTSNSRFYIWKYSSHVSIIHKNVNYKLVFLGLYKSFYLF